MEFGLNINNREPLLTRQYTATDMLDLANAAERIDGLDSVWVGDSLLEKPRLDPVACLAWMAAATDEVGLGTSCMLTPLRNPVRLAQAWTTLDILSGGRTILGACMGPSWNEPARKQYEVSGVPVERRALVLEEGIEVLRSLWETGGVEYHGEYFDFEGVTFDTGHEEIPFRPVQEHPPVWLVANRAAFGDDPAGSRAARRIARLGDGWLTAAQAAHPDAYEAQLDAIHDHARDVGRDPDEITAACQTTFHLADSKDESEAGLVEYLGRYYPARTYDLADTGPIGTADDVIEWIEEFSRRGCEVLLVRFGALDQAEQLDRFVADVLPSF